MNRRQFLRPQRLLPTAASFLDAAEELRSLELSDQPATAPALLRFSRRAMATTFEVIFPFGTPGASASATAVLDAVDCLEDQLSVYRQESEVSRLNKSAFQTPVQVEDNLFHLLSLAESLSWATAGAFDVAVGALIKAWGFFQRQGQVPTAEELAEVRTRSGMQHVVLDAEKRLVHFLRQSLEINVGSIGKGYALDRALAILQQHQVASALLQGGHSSILALGHEPGGNQGWSVGLRHPVATARRLGVWQLRDRALATSAATFQHLSYNGRKLGHILDPRSGWPAEGILGATVTAATAAEADALATAFFVLGVEGARVYCQAHPGIGAVLLPNLPGSRPVVLGTAVEDFQLDP